MVVSAPMVRPFARGDFVTRRALRAACDRMTRRALRAACDRMTRRALRAACVCVIACSFAIGSCVTYAEELNRGQRHFQASEYERALAIWRVLENDIDSLSPTDRTRYAYLRGMTDYRMSLRADARHWLAIARAYEQATPGGLEESWRDRMKEALRDLDNDVHGGGPAGADAGVD
jgi:hypothetical protein